jgi:3-hydroxyacyl-[acyl-carrier-protein] dehydratase
MNDMADQMEKAEQETVVFDSVQIQEIIPHRYPFLLVDKIVEFEENKRITGIKNVTANEPYFQGHFPGRPIMPGVLILEAMAQTGAILALKSSQGITKGKYIFLAGSSDMRWKRPVFPGDTLRIEIESATKKKSIWFISGRVLVSGKVVASGSISAAEME